ncbi:MAG: methyltransferase domain-containing protein [Proteobacteria bacterium]|nr:methyltransferase domain-containing protein [Pseudomonadota bacterium]
MHTELIEILRCPQSGQRFNLEEPEYREGRIYSGWLVSENGQHRYPIRHFIPRFVPESNYADNFGMQWNKFRKTQLDSYSGHPISADRFWKATGWLPKELKDQWVLDAGCGAGRFAEVLLEAGAKVVALDYSSAVDACFANLQHHPNLHLVQGDIYALPFVKYFFPFVYSLGVLQHTPDVAKAFAALPPMVTEGGRLCVDFYERSWKNRILPKYWLRPLTKKMPKEELFKYLQYWTPKLLPVSMFLGRIPVAGSWLKRLVPVANYKGILPLTEQQLGEWALLDTFDWLSPQFDNPQTAATVHEWFHRARLENIEVLKAGHLVGRGRKP